MKYFLVSKILNVFSHLIRVMPEAGIRFFSKGMAYVWFYVIQFRVRGILKNLNQAYGKTKSPSQIRKLAISNLEHYILLCLEVVLFRTLSEEAFLSRFEYDPGDLEKVKAALDRRESVLILTAHLGNFEWLASWTPLMGVPLAMVVRPLKSKLWEKLISKQRIRFGVELISAKGSGRQIFTYLQKKHAVAIIFDQLKRPPQGMWVPFFGKLAGTMKSLSVLAEKKNAVVFPVYSYRTRFGRMRVEALEPVAYKNVGTKEENRYAYTKTCTKLIEEMIQKAPEQWFWIHNRWRDSPGGT